MIAILLAAGYGTRLYPLTRDRAKPLLPVGGRPIIDYLVDRLEECADIERYLLVSNARFAADFERWAAARTLSRPLTVLNDGSTDNDNRLGAVADVAFALDSAGALYPGAAGAWGQDAYVLATDNLPRFDLLEIVALSRRQRASAVFACAVPDPAELRRMGVAELAADGRLLTFEEKPSHPKGTLRVPPFYVYPAADLSLVKDFLSAGQNPDAPGHFLAWLVTRGRPVYALRRDEGTYDIGTLASYRAVQDEFRQGS
jgi:glucose-1-phosphate thymidylyltransferase